eukprot:854534-Pyramimonas_sp.AAC.1
MDLQARQPGGESSDHEQQPPAGEPHHHPEAAAAQAGALSAEEVPGGVGPQAGPPRQLEAQPGRPNLLAQDRRRHALRAHQHWSVRSSSSSGRWIVRRSTLSNRRS